LTASAALANNDRRQALAKAGQHRSRNEEGRLSK
jgi:hypothetical protein